MPEERTITEIVADAATSTKDHLTYHLRKRLLEVGVQQHNIAERCRLECLRNGDIELYVDEHKVLHWMMCPSHD